MSEPIIRAMTPEEIKRVDESIVMRWIPCAERMPEEYCCVMAWAPGMERGIEAMYVGDDLWQSSFDPYKAFLPVENVTHWMPRPEGPEVKPLYVFGDATVESENWPWVGK